jgi:hypothetical protein
MLLVQLDRKCLRSSEDVGGFTAAVFGSGNTGDVNSYNTVCLETTTPFLS